ncbi:putative polysaccharide biosynthesis protein [Enterococcus sp. HY326]|uniref:putative polysaccharide biosynthesis protein n=1 Tax=Enterococcus sp. HY326 TaxID=2971265 RepID=UPI00223EAF49|nr:polysaccharide biosynthesis protein [Enterococcus sp. HY326]
MKGAAILTIASFIAKLLSAVYRVPFQNLVGDEGFYVYQQIYPIYGIAMTLALSGLPQFVSKYVAAQNSLAEEKQAMQRLMPLLSALSIGLWGLTLFGSGWIASLMGDRSLQPLLQVVSFTFLLMPGSSYYRGYFQGRLQMIPTAISQVLEQLVRVGIIIVAALFFYYLGWDVYQTGTLAMAGSVAGGLLAYAVLYYYDGKINGHGLSTRDISLRSWPDKALLRRFIIEGGLVSIYSGFLILFQLVDSFFVKNYLVVAGLSEEAAKIAKGVYDRGQPLVQLGLVVATALSATFLPPLTKSFLTRNQQQFQKNATIYLRLTASLALAATLGLVLLAPFINYALFKDLVGNPTLIVFVLAVGLMALIQTYQSITQSQNIFRKPLRGALLGFFTKLLTTGLLTYTLGTVGASLSTILGLLVTLVYLIRLLPPEINQFWRKQQFNRKLYRCLAVMTAVIFILYGVILVSGLYTHRSQALWWSLTGVALGASAFVITAIRVRLFTIREWLMFPFGEKILRFVQRREKK